MQRPIMNPSFLDDDAPAATPKLPLWRRFADATQAAARLLLVDLFFWRRKRGPQIEDGSPLRRLLRTILYRLAFVPIFLALIAAALVFLGTHPPRVIGRSDLVSISTYYDPVTILSRDGTRLDAWLVPALDAGRLLRQQDAALRAKCPAVVLVHDYAASPQQMVPLIRPLHDAGFVVLVLGLRGSAANWRGGCTFGLNESADVTAAVEMLRRRVYVDDNRIAIVGVGAGANAAILAAERDTAITALVLDHPATTVEQAVLSHIAPDGWANRWMSPLCKWTFELSYSVDAEDLDLSIHRRWLSSRHVLMFDDLTSGSCLGGRGVRQVREFLATSLNAAPVPAAVTEVRELPNP